MSNEKNFWEWYQSTAEKEGALVTPSTAAKMLGVKRQYIEKLVFMEYLKKHYYEDLPFIGLNDINKEIIRRQRKLLINMRNPNELHEKAKIEKLKERIGELENKIYDRENLYIPDENEYENTYEYYLQNKICILEDVLKKGENMPSLLSESIIQPNEDEDELL